MYKNFVKASISCSSRKRLENVSTLCGEDVKNIYLEEIKQSSLQQQKKLNNDTIKENNFKRKKSHHNYTENDYFLAAQNNNIDLLKQVLDSFPDKLNIVDEYGWSTLMIACKANSVETVKELLKRGADTSIRDKAGNSARSLVIHNQNPILADLLQNAAPKKQNVTSISTKKKVKRKEEYTCVFCNNTYMDKEEHISSTIHNINMSRHKKIPTNYKIPDTNKGYQIMLRSGWDKESGLGDGTGIKYPIKPVLKLDKRGLGHKVKKTEINEDSIKPQNKRMYRREYQRNKKIEIEFRREFY